MLIMPSFQKSLIVEQFQGNYLKVEVLKSACVVIIGGTLIYCFMSSCISQELERNARSIIGNIWSMTH